MARLVVVWTRPHRLSVEEADAWARREAARLLELDAIERAELTRLQSASMHHPLLWDWMLELHLRDGVDGRAYVDASACLDWLCDLRLLGMQPAVVLVDGTTTLSPEPTR
jgi:hypothetical protein